MTLDKAIFYKKEFRKPYYRSKRFDRTCRNHGSCPYCYNNRMFKFKKGLVEGYKESLLSDVSHDSSPGIVTL